MSGNLILFSTTDLAAGRREALQRMVASVDHYRAGKEGRVRLLILFQNAAGNGRPKLPNWVETHSHPSRIPLSEARNRLLAHVPLATAEDSNTVIAFPDDDAWYPAGALDFMRRQVADSKTVDLAFCRYGENTVPPHDGPPARKASLQTLLSNGSSITLFLRASLAARLGGFDETLGLGTPAGSGEDTDYALRAWHHARRSVYINAQLIGHRDKDAGKAARYHAGSLTAITRNRHLSLSARVAYWRKLAVGVVRGRFNISQC